MATSGSDTGTDPKSRFEWYLIGLSTLIVIATFYVAPAMNADLPPITDQIGQVAIFVLFGSTASKIFRKRVSGPSGSDDTGDNRG
ncbi:hypothetical protein [Saliphagus sp. LR7]|uniref:hypothetical protein n=1 Tax=Saliphagus sp. LR7 TaxID=2282654 RepID=UPI000DF84367|nr:hypothetical protein [Saliphagus sp. LR7]